MKINNAYKTTLLLLSSLGVCSEVSATSMTQSLAVTGSVSTVCTLASGAAIGFSAYNGASTVTASSTGISANCLDGVAYTIATDVGTGTGASYTNRIMTDVNSSTLQYNLYTSTGYTTVLGDGTNSTAMLTGTGNGSAQSYTAFGRMLTGQSMTGHAADAYTDTVTMTLTY